MKYIILGLCVFLCNACDTTAEMKPFDRIIQTQKYYSYKEYKEKKLETIYFEYLDLLKNKKKNQLENSKKLFAIPLKKKYKNFDDVVKNKNFFNIYPIDRNRSKNLIILVYSKNKAIVAFNGESIFDENTKCFYINYYLLTLENNKLNVTYIDGEGGEIVIPRNK